MSKTKTVLALGIGAVIGAVAATVLKDKISKFAADVLVRYEELAQEEADVTGRSGS